jgi:hypothetical protein
MSVFSQQLIAFTAEVNRLCKEECDRINADPKAIFGGEHTDYPEAMMKLYFDQGHSPESAIATMNAGHEADGYAEAMAS